MLKLAVDTSFLVPERTNIQLRVEFDAIQSWAARHNMIKNLAKTEVTVFRRPNSWKVFDITQLTGIKAVNEFELPGVILCDVLNFDSRVNFVLKLSI